jgi:hypothetical protein
MWLAVFAGLASVLAILFLVSRRRFRSWPLLVSSAAWALAAIYEWWFELVYDPAGKFNIRVDLLFVLGSCVVISLLAGAWSIRRRSVV